ncbi:beta-lactamase family protein [Apiospora saccharicola]|uniref:Beta-lactamase family protein n=1 Tax=Apiospora saccharicola TaxID=335842 RepID=A0ABR1TIV8_9PEZI
MEAYIRSPAFNDRIEAMMRSYHVPGLSLAIVHKGQTTSAGWGQASLDPQNHARLTRSSCSKSLTAASVALLVDDDEKYPEVQWDAIMSELLPDDFVMPGVGYTENVTLDDVLSHKTGMPRHDFSCLGPLASQTDTARSITRNLRNLSVAAPLRAKFMYNNLMYTVATHLIESKTQKPFSDFLEENFFVPLGMDSTHLQPSKSRERGLGDRIGTGHDWDKANARYLGFQWPDAPEAQGAGLVVSSANDLIKWVKALLHCEGPIHGRVFQGLVRLRTITELTWRKPKPHTTPAIYAAGLEVHTYRGQRVISHGGSGFGFSGYFFLLPDLHFGAVMLGNADGADDIESIVTKELIDELLGVPMPERLYLKSFAGKKKEKPPKSTKAKGPRSPPQTQGKPEGLDRESTKALTVEASAKAISVSGKEKKKPEDPKEPQSEPQTVPLSAYTGAYWHPGYRTLIVGIRDEKLFIDAPDRSFGFMITFEHIANNYKFKGHMAFHLSAGVDSPIDSEFVWEDDQVVRMGLDLEPDMKELIWFGKKKGGDDVAEIAKRPSEVGVV